MENRNAKVLENLKKEINLLASDMDEQDVAEFYSELADWAYANGEAVLMEDELEMQDYENQ
ncbi:phage protein [gut metagenome]|uniref:Phage protein n=1 Tax=gut metagenome TaxID=749906 RepID=J9GIV1_9ZZZZ